MEVKDNSLANDLTSIYSLSKISGNSIVFNFYNFSKFFNFKYIDNLKTK